MSDTPEQKYEMSASEHTHLSRRERQIMDALYGLGEASVAQIQSHIPRSPSYSTVRALLKKLLDKGHVKHRSEQGKYVYQAVLPKQDAKHNAIRRLINTFYGGSSAEAVVNLLGEEAERLTADDVQAIEQALTDLKKKGLPPNSDGSA